MPLRIGAMLIVLVVTCAVSGQERVRLGGGPAGMWRTESTPAGTAWTLLLDTDGSNRVIGAVSSCSSNRGEIEIFDGVIDRDTVAFKCLSLNRARTLSFTGQVDQDQIHFTWEKTGPGGNPTDDALFGASAPSRFSVRRVVGATSDAEARLAEVVSRIRRSPAVTFDELINAARHPQNWLTYSGDLRGHRHSPLTQITRSNVSDLELAWLAQAPTNSEIQATPLVVDGVMYTTRNTNDVVALDAASGRVLWEFNYTPLPSARASGGGGRPNRGLAILGGTLFLATLDAHLVAIDAYSGKPIWDKTVADASDPSCKGGPSCYSMTLAPLVIKDKVLVGVGGGEGRTRGFLAAFDARTGSEVWRFHTIPAQGEFGNDTWSGDSWRTGGAPIWNTGGYDPELDLTYWGTGNPSPPFDGSARRGDNLYSNSVVALDATTGKLRWYFQFTPHDVNDWDSTQVPVLTDLVWQGTPRKVMLWANRNGLFYVLDRTTGEFLMGEPFVQVNWTSGLDAKGRPMRTPRRAGDATRPSSATNWYPPSFSSRTGLFYVAAWERARTSEGPQLGKSFGAIRALNPSTGDTVWEFRLDDAVFWRGVMTTASDLLFTGTWGDFYSDPEDARRVDGYFYALDALTGTSLWKFALTGAIQSPPITYSVRGRQYVAVAARDTMFAFALR